MGSEDLKQGFPAHPGGRFVIEKIGDIITLGPVELMVIHTPGHAAGQISLYALQHRFLISADAVWDGDFGVLRNHHHGPPEHSLPVPEKAGSLS
jgi:glyoxylase-like metal-dependent hydrolase (beta-lactamase superfamily II)